MLDPVPLNRLIRGVEVAHAVVDLGEARIVHPAHGDPKELVALDVLPEPPEVDRYPHRRRHVAEHRHRRSNGNAWNGLHGVPLVEADAAMAGRQSGRLHESGRLLERQLRTLRSHEDVVDGSVVVLDRARGLQLLRRGVRRQQGEAPGRDRDRKDQREGPLPTMCKVREEHPHDAEPGITPTCQYAPGRLGPPRRTTSRRCR